MQSLFFKIFLGFCVVVVLVGTSLEASSIMANYYETRWQNVLHSVMPMEAEKCARMYETSGKQTVQDYLDELQRQYSVRSEEHTSELQSPCNLVCRLLLEKKK